MKHWNTLAFHDIQESIALGFLQLFHICSNENPTDLLMKFLGYQEAIPYLTHYYFGAEVYLTFPQRGVLTRLVNSSTFTLV